MTESQLHRGKGPYLNKIIELTYPRDVWAHNPFKQVDHQENLPFWLLVIWQQDEDPVGGGEPLSEASLSRKYENVSDIGERRSKIQP